MVGNIVDMAVAGDVVPLALTLSVSVFAIGVHLRSALLQSLADTRSIRTPTSSHQWDAALPPEPSGLESERGVGTWRMSSKFKPHRWEYLPAPHPTRCIRTKLQPDAAAYRIVWGKDFFSKLT